MKVYTSYYKKFEKIGPAYTLIRISNSKPKGFVWDIYKLPEVYPEWKCVAALKSGDMSEAEFEQTYREKLSKLNKEAVWNQIRDIAGVYQDDQRDVILLCWEKTGSFCHRHILAEWLGGVTEWGN